MSLNTVVKSSKKDFILYEDPRFFSAFPSVVPLKNEILLFFRRARDQRWLLTNDRSTIYKKLTKHFDHIDSRSEICYQRYSRNLNLLDDVQALPVNIEAADQDPSLLFLNDGTLLLASFSWYPFSAKLAPNIQKYASGYVDDGEGNDSFLFWGGYTRLSGDNGRTWSNHHYLPAKPGAPEIIPKKRPFHGGAIRGSLIEREGEVLLATYSSLMEGAATSCCFLYASKDNGRSWTYRTIIAKDSEEKVSFYEPSLYCTPKGKIVAFVRTGKLKDALVTVESEDGGYTWKKWEKHHVKGHPFHPLRLNDGRVLLSYGYRHKPYGIRARILNAECENISDAEEIILREDGFCEDVGYPWGTLLSDGRVCLVYYFCTKEDTVRHIACSVFSV